MRWIRVKRLREGLHPNEIIVSVTTAGGSTEELVVHKRSLGKDDMLLVGYPIGSDGKNKAILTMRKQRLLDHDFA